MPTREMPFGLVLAVDAQIRAASTLKASEAIEKLDNQGPALVSLVFDLFHQLEVKSRQHDASLYQASERQERAETAMMALRIERDEAREGFVRLSLNRQDMLSAEREKPTAPELLGSG